MSVSYNFATASRMTVAECVKLLAGDLGMVVSPHFPGDCVDMHGLRIYVKETSNHDEIVRAKMEFFGFIPKLDLLLVPARGSSPNYEAGEVAMMRAIDLMLRSTNEDAGFRGDRLYILRRDGLVYVREDFEKDLGPRKLQHLTVPYQRKALRP